jgi:hypothetical protein
MSVYIKSGVKVKINQIKTQNAPRPLPLESNFSTDKEYEVIGLHCPSETSEAYCILVNDLNQIWFISNRHLIVSG